ncbi:metallophosphoesterase family protein [Halpernia frigidisoli]|uniref:metallophosphoesterase family protein n=1 Tax=Halpernia frigidisoli TaxID=1125876 RepID=UPI000B0A04F0|nr:metallophosphoesterase [Halpernia frigidisoli]
MKILLIQLSDIHLKMSDNSILDKGDKLFEAIRNSSLEYDKIFLIVTGDTAFSGKKEEFEIGTNFIKNLQSKLTDYSKKDVHIIVIAGNHDCDFALDNKARQNQINMIQNLGDSAFDSSVIEQCTGVQEEYFNFKNQIQTDKPIYEDRLVSIYNFEFDDKKVIFHCYNTAYISEIHEQSGKMFFPTSILPDEILNEKGDIVFSLLHHPFHWLNPINRREFSTHIQKTSDFYLTGHEHESSREKIDNLENNIVYHLEGSVLQESDNIFESEFNLLGFDLDTESFKTEKYYWNTEKYNLADNNLDWINYKRSKNNFKYKYSLEDDFKELLNDVGGKFKHPNVSDINLSDIYVYPILRYFNTKDSTDNGISLLVENSDSVIQSIKQNSKYVFFGGENIGKSSLLRMIFFELLKKGFIPILVDGRLIKSGNFNDFKDIVKNVFVSQYGEDSLEDFIQEDISNIFIMIDDFDKNPLKNQKSKGKFIKNLSDNYKNLIFIGNELYAIEEIFTDEANSADLFSEFIQYEILEFNHSLRYKLINKWYALGNDDYNSDEENCRKIDDAVRAINVAMGQRIVPNYPIFLLILLQALETSNPHDLQISSYGNYYQLLILKTLTENIKDQTELNIYKSYCGELANFFFNKKSTILSTAEFSEFHDDIKSYEKLDLPRSMASAQIIETLCKAGILHSYGDNIEFKYQYTYYFFEAQHLSKYINRKDVKILISKLCQRLYRTEFANILLFLIHFSSDEFIIDELLKNAKDVFNELSPCKLEEDITLINSLVTELPKLYLKSKSHEEIREEENSIQDSKTNNQREQKQ